MLGYILFNAFLCAACIVCAYHFSMEERKVGIVCAIAVSVNWAIYASSWCYTLTGVDLSAWHLFNKVLGIPYSDEDIWALADASAAVLIVLIGHRFWWAYALWALYMLELFQHFARSINVGDFGIYSRILDMAFVAMVSVFVFIGGKGTLDHVSRIIGDIPLRWFRGVRHSLQCARAEEVSDGRR